MFVHIQIHHNKFGASSSCAGLSTLVNFFVVHHPHCVCQCTLHTRTHTTVVLSITMFYIFIALSSTESLPSSAALISFPFHFKIHSALFACRCFFRRFQQNSIQCKLMKCKVKIIRRMEDRTTINRDNEMKTVCTK